MNFTFDEMVEETAISLDRTIICGDCLEVMPTLEENSIDSIVTDPPYGLSFMGSEWDYGVPGVAFWKEALRVAKPGAHLLAFGGTRTHHRLAVAIEDAGWEIRDTIMWVYGQGFPKSSRINRDPKFCQCDVPVHNVSNNILEQEPEDHTCMGVDVNDDDPPVQDVEHSKNIILNSQDGCPKQEDVCDVCVPQAIKIAQESFPLQEYVREHTHSAEPVDEMASESSHSLSPVQCNDHLSSQGSCLHKVKVSSSNTLLSSKPADILKSSCHKLHNFLNLSYNKYTSGFPSCQICGKPKADGFGTNLKPAWEPVILARKPIEKGLTIAENVIKWGTGGINVDGCRVPGLLEGDPNRFAKTDGGWAVAKFDKPPVVRSSGRFPANLIHDGSEEVTRLFLKTGPSKVQPRNQRARCAKSKGAEKARTGIMGHNDNGGSAARFFYCAKASKKDRDEGLEGFEDHFLRRKVGQPDGRKEPGKQTNSYPAKNNHPTVKPTSLMAYLCRLVTPPGGLVLDPFAGSGSTGKACKQEGFRFVGIEMNEEYCTIARARIE